MPEDSLIYLGACIRKAREDLGLSRCKLSEQSGVSERHIANIEKGRMNPSYEVLKQLIERLGISADKLFYPDYSGQNEKVLDLIGKFNACSDADRQVLLRTLNCLADELLSRSASQKSKSEEAK